MLSGEEKKQYQPLLLSCRGESVLSAVWNALPEEQTTSPYVSQASLTLLPLHSLCLAICPSSSGMHCLSQAGWMNIKLQNLGNWHDPFREGLATLGLMLICPRRVVTPKCKGKDFGEKHSRLAASYRCLWNLLRYTCWLFCLREVIPHLLDAFWEGETQGLLKSCYQSICHPPQENCSISWAPYQACHGSLKH